MQVAQPIKEKDKIKQIQAILKRQSYRDWLLFTLGINSGLHLHDLLSLKVGDLRGKSKTIVVERRTRKEKTLTINSSLRDSIHEYTMQLEDNEFLFPSQRTNLPIKRIRVYHILNDAAKQAGLPDIGTHTLRKTFGYHLYQKTKNIAVLQDLFNHSAPSVTLRYIGVTDGKKREII